MTQSGPLFVTTRGGSRHPPGLLVPSHTQSFGRGDLGGVEEARGGATSLMEKLLAGANLICEGLGAVSSAVAGSDTEALEVAVSVAAQWWTTQYRVAQWRRWARWAW